MNNLAEKSISYAVLKKTAGMFPGWSIFCLLLWILAQSFFLVYPPRGYIADDIILLGSVRGQPLISIQHLWEDVYNDDRLMLEVLEKSGIHKGKNRIEALEFLNENIRKNLRFSVVNEVLFRVSFIQPGKSSIRPFLNTFSERFLAEAAAVNDDELQRRRHRVTFQFEQLNRRNYLVHRLLAPASLLADLTPGEKGFSGELKLAENESWYGKMAMLIINELNQDLYSARVNLSNHTDLSQKILAMFPFNTIRLTDPETPARPVQPYLIVFYLFIPLAVFLFYLAGLIYLAPEEERKGSDAA
jgi:hypothetical protein